jgi:hypothetical protein
MWLVALAYSYCSAEPDCQGPPYLLATFHGGTDIGEVNQVYKYSLDGCVVSTAVLNSSDGVVLNELRDLALLPDGGLVVNNACKDDSMVLLYGDCDASGARPFQDILAQGAIGDSNSLLVHPYGVATSNGRVIVSTQDTCSVLAYNLTGSAEPAVCFPCRFFPSRTTCPPKHFQPENRPTP